MSGWSLLFWICLGLLVYVYLGYPVLCRLLAGLLRRQPRTEFHQPRVTICIAAYNEADVIVATLLNKLALEYPAELLEILVVSDESEDGTDELVRQLDEPRIKLFRQSPRAGKTAALNLVLPHATGEIIVFSDANSLYALDALRELLAPFADPEVGYVTGRMVYLAADGSLTGEGCSAYMRYENVLRDWETRIGSVVGVDGGIDAVRRELYQPMRPDQLPDFVLPLTVRQQGYRVVYRAEALLYEEALAEAEDEFRMRVRVGLRAWHALKDKALLLNPFRYGLFAWQLFSHKVLRYLAPLFQLGALAANLALLGDSRFWWAVLGAQAGFYLLAGFGHLRRRHHLPTLVMFCYYLCVINSAASVALIRFLRGQKQVTWQPRV
ncbi:MAG: glycosyltransferase family 2 protein [bacterium]